MLTDGWSKSKLHLRLRRHQIMASTTPQSKPWDPRRRPEQRYRPPKNAVARAFWRKWMWIEATFALSMLETWEKIFVGALQSLTYWRLLDADTRDVRQCPYFWDSQCCLWADWSPTFRPISVSWPTGLNSTSLEVKSRSPPTLSTGRLGNSSIFSAFLLWIYLVRSLTMRSSLYLAYITLFCGAHA